MPILCLGYNRQLVHATRTKVVISGRLNFTATRHASIIGKPIHAVSIQPEYRLVKVVKRCYTAGMKISTKGRYALQVMVEFAVHNGEVLSLKSVAEVQGISLKYLEQIVQKLVKANLLLSFRGASGGYKLAKQPDATTVAEILNATEGSLAVVNCMDKKQCGHICHCRIRKCWDKLNLLIDDYLQSVTLAELLRE